MSSVRVPALLVIMDGCGLAPAGPENAVSLAKRPYIDMLNEKYPHSEVGHLNICAGRIVFQSLSLVNNAIKDGSFKSNDAIVAAMDKVKANGSTLHVMGLVSNGGVHSEMGHAEALLEMAGERGLSRVRIDAFTDGRDVPTQSGAGFMHDLQAFCEKVSEKYGNDTAIATVAGRYYGMDRDNRWDREQLAYDAIVSGKGDSATSAEQGLRDYYTEDPRGDEFVKPFVLDATGVNDGDAVVFFNFRPDRAREMTRAMTQADFDGFERTKTPKLADFVTMTEYDDSFENVHVAFPKTVPANVLADVLAANGLKQLHTAETEKYAHVTFFLNGGVEEPKEGETRVLIPSPKVATYDLKPEMSEPEVTEKLVEAINSDAADFYVVNYANCDMVGHTGVVEAAVKACEAVDDGLSKVIPAILAKGGFALITADHGNADHMYDVVDGKEKPFTAHTTNRVPLIVVDDKPVERAGIENGRLSDIAPTILAMMGVDRPAEMTGRVLVK